MLLGCGLVCNKASSLKGVWYRTPVKHSGSIATLEDWFDPNRLKVKEQKEILPVWSFGNRFVNFAFCVSQLFNKTYARSAVCAVSGCHHSNQ